MIYIKLFRDMQKNILPESGRILLLGNHFFPPMKQDIATSGVRWYEMSQPSEISKCLFFQVNRKRFLRLRDNPSRSGKSSKSSILLFRKYFRNSFTKCCGISTRFTKFPENDSIGFVSNPCIVKHPFCLLMRELTQGGFIAIGSSWGTFCLSRISV